jgi:hypothetical protein
MAAHAELRQAEHRMVAHGGRQGGELDAVFREPAGDQPAQVARAAERRGQRVEPLQSGRGSQISRKSFTNGAGWPDAGCR